MHSLVNPLRVFIGDLHLLSRCLRDGVVDIGTVLPPYYLAEYSIASLVANLSTLSTTGGVEAAMPGGTNTAPPPTAMLNGLATS